MNMFRLIVDSIKQLQASKPYTFDWFRSFLDDEFGKEAFNDISCYMLVSKVRASHL